MSHLSTIIERVKKQADLQNEENLKKNVENIKDYIEAWNDYTERELIEAYDLWHKYGPRLDDYGELPLDNTPHVRLIPREEVSPQELTNYQDFEGVTAISKVHIMEDDDDE